MESQPTTTELCRAMLICVSLASVWPRSIDNYSSLAQTWKLIMKDKQSSACQLPTRIRSHMKSLQLSTEPEAPGLVTCQRMSNMEPTCCISLDMCLTTTVLFPAYRDEDGRRGEWRYLFMVETLPVFSTHSTAGVPISCSLACTVVCVTEEAAGWSLTGCCGTERRLRHPSSSPTRKESTLNKQQATNTAGTV